MQVSGDIKHLQKHFCLSMLVFVGVAWGLDWTCCWLADSPDQTAAGSEFNAAGQKKHALTNGGCTP
jgi:hypothetical protein